MSMVAEPLVIHAPIEPVFDDLRAWVERYLARYPDQTWLHQEVVEVPFEAAGWLLTEHVRGAWDLTPDEVAHLWFIGRAMGGRRTELLSDEVLAEALPGRGERPDDPPGRWVLDLLLPGGAHQGGVNRPGKSEFPLDWDGDDILDLIVEVAEQPQAAVELPNGTFRAWGERRGVRIGVVVAANGELLTAYPVDGPGVGRNALTEAQRAAVDVLEAFLDGLQLPRGEEPRVSYDELIAAGEWPHVVACLLALDADWSHQQRVDLAELAEVSGEEIPGWFLHGG